MLDPRTVTSNEVYILYLNDDGSPKVPREYVYIDPQSDGGFTLRFSIEGTSPICRHGSLWINVPEEGVGFERNEYREYPYETEIPPKIPPLPRSNCCQTEGLPRTSTARSRSASPYVAPEPTPTTSLTATSLTFPSS